MGDEEGGVNLFAWYVLAGVAAILIGIHGEKAGVRWWMRALAAIGAGAIIAFLLGTWRVA